MAEGEGLNLSSIDLCKKVIRDDAETEAAAIGRALDSKKWALGLRRRRRKHGLESNRARPEEGSAVQSHRRALELEAPAHVSC